MKNLKPVGSLLTISLLTLTAVPIKGIQEKPLAELIGQDKAKHSVERGPLAGGMGYTNRTDYFQINPEVASRAPELQSKMALFMFNDNPMYGYILIDGEKINYQRSNVQAQDPDSATLGVLDNYYVIVPTGDLSRLIRISQPPAL